MATEEELELQAQLLDGVTDSVLLHDFEGNILYVNEAACKLHGYSKEELVKMKLQQLVGPERVSHLEADFSEMKEKGEAIFESAHRLKDGSVITVEVHGRTIESGGKTLLLTSVRNTTRRKEVEALYRTLANSSSVGVYIVQDRKFRFVNSRFQKYTGYSEDELLGMESLSIVHPEDREAVRQTAIEMLKSNQPSSPYEFKYVGKDGKTIWAMETVTPISYGGRRAALGNFMDITERKQAETKLQELYDKEAALRQELENEIDKRVELTRTLIHELKTPLTPMVAASDLLMEETSDGPIFQLARSINRGAHILINRIDNLLDVAKGELGILELNCREIAPLELLHSVSNDVSPLAVSHEQIFVPDLPDSLPAIWADEERLRQVVVNLLDNSFKFTPNGGKITLRAKEEDNNIIIEVDDSGPGLSEEQKQHLFEAHYRFKSEPYRAKGLGLGLALSKMLVELHGGKIWAESQKGKSSKFSFSLPVYSQHTDKIEVHYNI